mgnify:CR=1 FL=1
MSPFPPPLPLLEVRLLGAFELSRGGVLQGDKVWSRDSALELFQFLLGYRGQCLARARILAELWPEKDPQDAERDFKVALNALNDALEPERPARQLARYLRRQGSSYGLAPDAPIALDAEAFEAEALAAARVAEPEAATLLYRRALERYRGDYLPERLGRDWSAPQRERLQSLFLTSATRLAQILAARGEASEVLHWCARVLELDPLWEEACRLLMRAHLGAGNRPGAVRAYRSFAGALEAALGLEPMPATTRLYAAALAGEESA